MQIGIYYERPLKDAFTDNLRNMMIIQWGDGRESKFKLDAQKQLVSELETDDFEGDIEKLVAEIQAKSDSGMSFYYVDEQGNAFTAELINLETSSYITVKDIYESDATEKTESTTVGADGPKPNGFFGFKPTEKEIKLLLICLAGGLVIFIMAILIAISAFAKSNFSSDMKSVMRKGIHGIYYTQPSKQQEFHPMPKIEPKNFVGPIDSLVKDEKIVDVEVTVAVDEVVEIEVVLEEVPPEASGGIVIYNYGTININP